MKIIRNLVGIYLLLIVRVPLALFFNMILPLAFFVFYAGVLTHASGPEVSGLIVRLVTLGALSNGLFGLSINLVVMRERDILRRYHLAPVSAFHIVVSRLLANYLLFLAVILLELAAAQWVFLLDLTPVLPAILVIFSIGYLAVAGIGFMIAAIANTVGDAQVYSQLAFFGLLFLSGIAVPLASLPRLFQNLAAFIPPSLTIVAADLILRHRAPLGAAWPELFCLSVISIVTISVATVLFRWEKDSVFGAKERLQAAMILIPLIATGIWLNTSVGFAKRLNATAESETGSIQTAPVNDWQSARVMRPGWTVR